VDKVEAPIVNHAQYPTSRGAVFSTKVRIDFQPKLGMYFLGLF